MRTVIILYFSFLSIALTFAQKKEISIHTGALFFYRTGSSDHDLKDKLNPSDLVNLIGFELALPVKSNFYIKSDLSFFSYDRKGVLEVNNIQYKKLDVLLEGRLGKKKSNFSFNGGLGFSNVNQTFDEYNVSPITWNSYYLNFSANLGYVYQTDNFKIGLHSGCSYALNKSSKKPNPTDDYKLGYSLVTLLPQLSLGIRL